MEDSLIKEHTNQLDVLTLSILEHRYKEVKIIMLRMIMISFIDILTVIDLHRMKLHSV